MISAIFVGAFEKFQKKSRVWFLSKNNSVSPEIIHSYFSQLAQSVCHSRPLASYLATSDCFLNLLPLEKWSATQHKPYFSDDKIYFSGIVFSLCFCDQVFIWSHTLLLTDHYISFLYFLCVCIPREILWTILVSCSSMFRLQIETLPM